MHHRYPHPSAEPADIHKPFKMGDRGASSPVPSSSGRDFAATHPVKKLLETYRNTAGRTLTGPAASSLEAGGNASRYRLPPDVELSKTSVADDDDDHRGGSHEHNVALQHYQQQYGAPQHKLMSAAEAQEAKLAAANGMVTLSRLAI